MANFRLGDFAFDRMISATAEAKGDIQYVLSQLQNATIEVSAEAKEIKDKDGNLIRKIYSSKTGTFTAPNAMLNANVMNAGSGNELEVASATNPINMPKIIYVKAGETATLTDFVEGTVKVKAVFGNGASGDSYAQATTASETEFGLAADGTLTPPAYTLTESDPGYDAEAKAAFPTKFLVKYYRTKTTGVALRNSADKFPDAVELTIKAVYVAPCEEGVKAAYIYLPALNVDPNVSISTESDTTIDYKGDLAVDMCADNKDLYVIYFPDEDEDE